MKKIMFSDKYCLTKAVLEGRKTMTRRAVPEKLLEAYYDYDDYVNAVAPSGIPYTREYEKEFFLRRSRFKVGEVVAVAQNYKDVYSDKDFGKEGQIDWEYINSFDMRNTAGFTNKMLVRADLMPHQIRITNVRLERLQDISDDDCLLEGVERIDNDDELIYKAFDTKGGFVYSTTPMGAFAALIDRISGKGTWKRNPWVFVYEFELVK